MGPGRTEHNGKAYELTGPIAVTAADIAGILSAAGGQTIAHVDGAEAFEKHCADLGMPDMIKHVYHEAAGGWFGKIEHDPFTAVVGRTPNSFGITASDYSSHFAASP